MMLTFHRHLWAIFFSVTKHGDFFFLFPFPWPSVRAFTWLHEFLYVGTCVFATINRYRVTAHLGVQNDNPDRQTEDNRQRQIGDIWEKILTVGRVWWGPGQWCQVEGPGCIGWFYWAAPLHYGCCYWCWGLAEPWEEGAGHMTAARQRKA